MEIKIPSTRLTFLLNEGEKFIELVFAKVGKGEEINGDQGSHDSPTQNTSWTREQRITTRT